MTSEMREWLKKNAKNYTDREKFVVDCMKKFSRTRERVNDLICEMKRVREIPVNVLNYPPGPNKRATQVTPEPVKGRPFRMSVDVSEIKKEYDDEKKIAEGVKALGTHLIKDNDFRMELGVSVDRWKIVSNLPKFVNNRRELKGKRFKGLFWGDAAVIRDLSKKIDLL